MTTSTRNLHVFSLAAALCVSLMAGAQTPPAVPAAPAPAPAPAPVAPPAEAPPVKPAAPPAPKPAAKPAAKAAPKKAEVKKSADTTFSGTVNEADKVNFTLTLSKARVLHVTPETRFFKAGKPAVFDDVVVGEEVSGQYQKGKDGELEALAMHIATKPAAPAGGKKSEKKPVEKKPFTD